MKYSKKSSMIMSSVAVGTELVEVSLFINSLVTRRGSTPLNLLSFQDC